MWRRTTAAEKRTLEALEYFSRSTSVDDIVGHTRISLEFIREH